jgi:pseudaminic acid cytidylyltransferase
MNVAIIPARGGSKRIPNKNIKHFRGKPVIAYSIDAAKKSELFDQIVVSTDSEEIAEVAVKSGAEVPFIRPSELSDDYTPTAPVLEHAVTWLISHGNEVEYFCCIYPTAVFLRSKDIRQAFLTLRDKKVPEVYSITAFEFCIFRGVKLAQDGGIKFLWPENELKRSQDFPEVYHDAGQFYWFDSKEFLKHKSLYDPNALPFIIPRYLVCDIDTADDWETAEVMFEACKKKGLL